VRVLSGRPNPAKIPGFTPILLPIDPAFEVMLDNYLGVPVLLENRFAQTIRQFDKVDAISPCPQVPQRHD
jgi:hypothetical protein